MRRGTPFTKEEIEKEHPDGKYDEDGFFVLPDGSSYDKEGYYFDAEGYDEFGGYYENH